MNEKHQQLLDAFRFRHACKQFDESKKIPQEDFSVILEAARLSPSSFGFEPWHFLVVQDTQLREALFPVAWGAQNSLRGASHFVILLARKKTGTLFDAGFVDHMMRDIQQLPEETITAKRSFYENFQKKDFNLLESDRSLYDWASKQTYIALANMMTSAAFLGIDSCPIEGFNIAAVEALLAERGLINPDEFGVSLMAGFGYRAKAPYPKTRQPLEDIVRWI